MSALLVGGLIALGGVLIGAVLSGIVELWRVLLATRAAVRIVRFEIQDNVNRCQLAIAFNDAGLELSDFVWRENRTLVGQLLPEKTMLALSTGYSAIFLAQRCIRSIKSDAAVSKGELVDWCSRMMAYVALLRQIESRSRFVQMLDLVTGRRTHAGGGRNEALLAVDKHFQLDSDVSGRAKIDEVWSEMYSAATGRPAPDQSDHGNTPTETRTS